MHYFQKKVSHGQHGTANATPARLVLQTTLLSLTLALAACSGEQKFGSKNADAAQDAGAAGAGGISPGEGELSGESADPSGRMASGDGIPGAGGENPAGLDPSSPDVSESSNLETDSDGNPIGPNGGVIVTPQNTDLFNLPQAKTALKIEGSDTLAKELLSSMSGVTAGSQLCLREFNLDAVSPDGTRDLDAGQLQWKSTRPDIVKIKADGTAVITGSGSVTLVVAHTDADGNTLQDNVTVEIPAPQTGFKATAIKAIVPVVSATASRMSDSFSNFKDGIAKGRVGLTHPEPNITIGSVDILVHSSDFKNFVFDGFSAPKKNESTCLWEVEFDIAFTYLFVPETVEYAGQAMRVNFAEGTERNPYGVNLTATLRPTGSPEDAPIVFRGSGTDGFSPAR